MKYKILSPKRPFELVDVDGETYFDFLVDAIKKTDEENWEYFLESEKDIAKNYLSNGDLSRVIVSDVKHGQGKYDWHVYKAVAYIQLQVLKPMAPALLFKDQYHNLGIPSKSLFLNSSEIKKNTPLYINVVAAKEEYQNSTKLLRTLVRALDDILQSIPEMPSEIYAVGVTDAGRKMCDIISNEKNISVNINKLSTVKRTEDLNGKLITHDRALYRYDSCYFCERIESIIGKKKKKQCSENLDSDNDGE